MSSPASPGEESPLPAADESARWSAWEEAQRAWLESKRRRSGGPNTARAYRLAWEQFLAWAGVPPWAIDAGLAAAWARHLAQTGLAARTINLKLSALTSFYDFVGPALWPAGQGNPFRGVPRPAVPPYRRRSFPSPGEVRAILAAINTGCLTGQRDYALLLALLVTACRPAEVLGLRWGDLAPLDGGDYTCAYRSQAGVMRRAVLSRAAYQAICAYLERAGRPPAHLGAGEYIFVPIFPGRARRLPGGADRSAAADRPLSVSFANRILKKYARRAGVDRTRAHLQGWRRAAARWKLMLP